MNDMYTDQRDYSDLRGHIGPDPRYADTCGEPDEPMAGDIRAKLIADPDAHQTSFRHYGLTGVNWIGKTCHPDNADIQSNGV